MENLKLNDHNAGMNVLDGLSKVSHPARPRAPPGKQAAEEGPLFPLTSKGDSKATTMEPKYRVAKQATHQLHIKATHKKFQEHTCTVLL